MAYQNAPGHVPSALFLAGISQSMQQASSLQQDNPPVDNARIDIGAQTSRDTQHSIHGPASGALAWRCAFFCQATWAGNAAAGQSGFPCFPLQSRNQSNHRAAQTASICCFCAGFACRDACYTPLHPLHPCPFAMAFQSGACMPHAGHGTPVNGLTPKMPGAAAAKN